jgi:hypothetical protein
MGGDTNQWEPGNLVRNTTPIYPYVGNPGWNLTTAMADEAIRRADVVLDDLWPDLRKHVVRREPYGPRHISAFSRDAVLPGCGGEASVSRRLSDRMNCMSDSSSMIRILAMTFPATTTRRTEGLLPPAAGAP